MFTFELRIIYYLPQQLFILLMLKSISSSFLCIYLRELLLLGLNRLNFFDGSITLTITTNLPVLCGSSCFIYIDLFILEDWWVDSCIFVCDLSTENELLRSAFLFNSAGFFVSNIFDVISSPQVPNKISNDLSFPVAWYYQVLMFDWLLSKFVLLNHKLFSSSHFMTFSDLSSCCCRTYSFWYFLRVLSKCKVYLLFINLLHPNLVSWIFHFIAKRDLVNICFRRQLRGIVVVVVDWIK